VCFVLYDCILSRLILLLIVFVLETDRYHFFQTDTDIFYRYLASLRYSSGHRYRYSKLVVITVGGITMRGTLVVTVGEKGLTQCLELDGVGSSCKWWTDPTTDVTPEMHGPQSGSRVPGAWGVDPHLAATTLDRGSPNLTGADEARKFGICWANRADRG